MNDGMKYTDGGKLTHWQPVSLPDQEASDAQSERH
jgi:hypothetical protein